MGPIIKFDILQYTRFHIRIVEAKVLFGQRLQGIDSSFPSRGVENWAAIYSSHYGQDGLSGAIQHYSSSRGHHVAVGGVGEDFDETQYRIVPSSSKKHGHSCSSMMALGESGFDFKQKEIKKTRTRL